MKSSFLMEGALGLITILAAGAFTVAEAGDCDPVPAGIIAWWQAEGNAHDLTGGTDSVLKPGTSFTTGIVGQGFSFDGVNGCMMNTNPPLTTITNSFTIEFWANPAQGFDLQPEGGGMGISGQSYAVFPDYGGSTGGAGVGVSVGTNGISVLEHAAFYLPSLLSYAAPINGWTHIAVVYAHKQPTLYVNGLNVRTGLTSPMNFVFPGKNLGSSYGSSDGNSYTTYGPYKGLLDEVCIYNRALTADEVAAIYNAGSAGKCFTPTPPVITVQPASTTNYVGTTATFSVGVTGAAPFAYQWSFNGTNLADATNASLVVASVQYAQAGGYAVQISNAAGSTNSAVAMLALSVVPPCDPMPAGIASWFQADGNAHDTISGSDGTLTGGVTFASGVVGQCYSFDGAGGCVLNDNTPPLTNIQNTFTIEFWARPQGNMAFYTPGPNFLDNGGQMQLAVFPEFGNSDDEAGVGIGVGTNGIAVVEHTYNYLPVLLNYTNSLSGWTHVALVYTDKQPSLYVNGAKVATGITSPMTFVYPSKTFGGSTAPQWSYYGPYQGLLDEISIYDRALTAGEISGIFAAGSGGKCFTITPPLITAQPMGVTNLLGTTATLGVAASGTPPMRFQWSFNGTAIAGATNATLVLPDVQFSQAGDYSVLVSNAAGFTNSATATLGVYALPPYITGQPASTVAVIGSTIAFNVSAAGSAPLSYQWSFNGANLLGATNSSLTLANVQFSQAGYYAVQISNLAGVTNSIAAALTVNPVPPCDMMASGAVGWWQAEGNALNSVDGSTGTVSPGVSFADGLVGQCFNFDGASGCIANDNSPSLSNIQNSFTIEFWALPRGNMTFYAPATNALYNGGQMQLAVFPEFGGSGGQAGVGIGVGTNGIAVVEHAYNYLPTLLNYTNSLTGWTHVALVYNNKQPVLYVNGTEVATGITSSRTFVYPSKNFGGSPSYIWNSYGPYQGLLDEISIYNRPLTVGEISAIYVAGSAGKCPAPPFISAEPASITNLVGTTATFSVGAALGTVIYQWTFDGTNINSATNSTLTLTNVQPEQAGIYAVLLSNNAGATNSTGATLTVVTPPIITLQPQSQSVTTYNSATFGVVATGTGPLSYQWQKNGVNLTDGGNISGSATANLSLLTVSPADAGSYQVVISTPYASTNSATAVLTVPETVISLGSLAAMSGGTITVPVVINAVGLESGFVGSISYDPTKLMFQSVVGAMAGPSDTNNGYASFLVQPSNGDTWPAGSNHVADLVFAVLPVTNNAATTVAFVDHAVSLYVSDVYGNQLPAIYNGGTIQLAPAEYYADVSPRFGGDHQVVLGDWVEIGRMVAGLDTPTNSDEMLRADCAPRGNPDGVLTVADWVQAARYTLKIDPPTLVVTPPTGNAVAKVKPHGGGAPDRILQVATIAAARGQTVNVPVSLICVSNETAVGLTISYDPSQLRLLNVRAGAVLAGGGININSNQSPGKVGMTLGMSRGFSFPAGSNQLAMLQFAISTNASGTAPITLDNSIARLAVADLLAMPVSTAYVPGSVTLPPRPPLAVAVSGHSLQFSWPLAAGTFQVEAADQPTGPWTTLVLPLITNGANVSVLFSPTNQQHFYRLDGH